MDIEKQLKRQKKVNFLREIEFENKRYAKAYKMNKNGIEYYYFEIENEKTFKEVTDTGLLEYFREIYEVKLSDIMY